MEAATQAQAPAEPAEPASEPPGAPQADPGNGADERDETGRYLSREQQSYRRRLRETEAERDTLREQLNRLQTAEVERLASAAGLAVAGDVWLHGASLDTLRGDDGAIDAETVTGLVQELVRDRPGLRAPKNGDIGIGRGAAARPPQSPKVGLSQLLKP